MKRDKVVAERGARVGSAAASVVGTVSVAWQARDMVTWPASAAPRPGAVAELMLQPDQTPWYKVLEIIVAITSSMEVVSTFLVRMKGAQGKKRAEFMFGVGKGLHRSCVYKVYHEEDGWSVWYGLRGLQGVGGDEVPASVMHAVGAWVKER